MARLFKQSFDVVSRRLDRFVPKRVSRVVGFTFAAVVFITVFSVVIFRLGLDLADAALAELDALQEPGMESPPNRGSLWSAILL